MALHDELFVLCLVGVGFGPNLLEVLRFGSLIVDFALET